MAREYANIVTAIWRDRDFRALCAADQRMYLLVVTQPDISAAGTLPLTVGRWASLASDTTAEMVRASLERLSAGRFVYMDLVTEELLVRSFVRHDKGYSNRKRLPVIRRAAAELVSPALAWVLAEEFTALGLDTDVLSDALSHSPSLVPSERVAEGGLEGGFEEGFKLSVLRGALSTNDGTFSQVDSLSDTLWHSLPDGTSPSDGVVVSTVSGSIPHPSTHIPAASGRDAAEGGSPKRKPKRATPLPASWAPTEEHEKRAASLGVDLARQVELFRLHVEANGRTAKQWNAAFTTWLIKAPTFDRGATTPAPAAPKLTDRDSASEWVRDEWRAGRVVDIEQRTGLRYRRPDLPNDVSGREAAERWSTEHARQWIADNRDAIIDRLVLRSAS
jgi:hypothetical protein